MSEFEIFNNLKETLKDNCRALCKYLLSYDVDGKNVHNDKLLTMIFENFKNLEVVLHIIDIQGFTQIGALLRSSLEGVSILRAIYKNDVLYEEYLYFYNLKKAGKSENSASETIFKDLFKKRKFKESVTFQMFKDYGWLEKINQKPSINNLFKVVGMDEFIEWRELCNSLVHGDSSFLLYSKHKLDEQIKKVIYITGILYTNLTFILNETAEINWAMDGIDRSSNYRMLMDFAEKIIIRNKNKINDK